MRTDILMGQYKPKTVEELKDKKAHVIDLGTTGFNAKDISYLDVSKLFSAVEISFKNGRQISIRLPTQEQAEMMYKDLIAVMW